MLILYGMIDDMIGWKNIGIIAFVVRDGDWTDETAKGHRQPLTENRHNNDDFWSKSDKGESRQQSNQTQQQNRQHW